MSPPTWRLLADPALMERYYPTPKPGHDTVTVFLSRSIIQHAREINAMVARAIIAYSTTPSLHPRATNSVYLRRRDRLICWTSRP
jgi:hypothetical protein